MFDDFGNDIERRLEEILMPVSCEYSDLLEAMAYSARAGGK